MFDFLRNLTKSAEEKDQERLHAYLDNALTPRERQQFEQELELDPVLKVQLDNTRVLKEQLGGLPRRPVPRNFTLDPAVYGRPARQPLFQYYPVLQGATALAALFFILAISLSLFQTRAETGAVASAPQTAMTEAEMAVTEAPAAAPLAFNTADEAGETAVEPPAEEEEMAEEEAPAEEETMAEEDASEETAGGEAAAEESPAEPATDTGAVPSAAMPTTEPPALTAPAEATAVAPSPTTSTTPLPTPTISVPPRPITTETADARSLELQTTTAPDDGQSTTTDSTTANMVEQQSLPTPTPMPTSDRPIINPLGIVQITLGILLILLGALTFYVRRNS